MDSGNVSFSVVSHTAWAPGLDTAAAWQEWACGRKSISALTGPEPRLKDMPPLLRRRASSAGKMAIEVACQCLPKQSDIPVIFASRHGECARSVELLLELANHAPLSPTSFSLSVHNASVGLLSIARGERGNHIAIAAGPSTVEHALIEACALLADGAAQVLLVMSDNPPSQVLSAYNDCAETGFAWAWLLQAMDDDRGFSLSWSAAEHTGDAAENLSAAPSGLDVLCFFLRDDSELTRIANGRRWRWSRHV